jgi:phage terminase large subunit-like protein
LIIHLTTADFDRPSICNEKYDYASKVRDGIIQDREFLPVIYELTRKDKWTKQANWKKANPNLGISLPIDYLKREYRRAREIPAYENTFKRLHLNLRTEQAVRWLPLDKWDDCGTIEIDEKELALVAWFAGLDLATTIDIAAFVMYSAENDAVICRFWIPRESAYERERRDRVPYLAWAREGLVTLTDGNVIDYDRIRQDIVALGERYNIQEIAVDRWGSQQIQNQLSGDGFDVVPFGQGYASMSAPTKELEKLIIGGTLRHNNNSVLKWMAGNVTVELDAAGNIKPSKKRSTEKIDGITALVMAIGRAISGGAITPSRYETKGIRVL